MLSPYRSRPVPAYLRGDYIAKGLRRPGEDETPLSHAEAIVAIYRYPLPAALRDLVDNPPPRTRHFSKGNGP